MDKIVYTIGEVASLLGISKSYAYELTRSGTIPHVTLGRKRLIPKEEFHSWIKQTTRESENQLSFLMEEGRTTHEQTQ